MALKDIMAISGQSGLFKFVSQGRNGIIVESLTDGKRTLVSTTAKVSALSDIAIFTNDGEKTLREVLNSIKEKENGGVTISHKSSNDDLKKFFVQILPDFDTERVYISDIKKVVAWYNQLQSLDMLDFTEDEQAEEEANVAADEVEVAEEGAEKAADKKKAKVAKAASTAAKKKPAAKKPVTKGVAPKSAPVKMTTRTQKKA